MLAKYHSDLDPSILLNYSLMFTGLKKNGDVKVWFIPSPMGRTHLP